MNKPILAIVIGSILVGFGLGYEVNFLLVPKTEIPKKEIMFFNLTLNPDIHAEHANYTPGFYEPFQNEFYKETMKNKNFTGITAYDCIFIDCTLYDSTIYHCRLIDTKVVRAFVYASLFEYDYGYRYVDFSDGRKTYNMTVWWDEVY